MAEIFCAIYEWGHYEDRDHDMVYVGSNEAKARKALKKEVIEKKCRKYYLEECTGRHISVYNRGKFVRDIDLNKEEEKVSDEASEVITKKLEHYKNYLPSGKKEIV